MSRNIYDVFNERKTGLDSLLEGSSEELEYEVFDSVEEAAYAMEEIIQEDANACIEFQAASYLEDLVLEHIMFDSFDEENTRELLNESFASRKESIMNSLREAWKRIKAWFNSVKETIAKALRLSADWVLENKDKIGEGIKNCNIKVKYPMYYDFRGGVNRVKKMIDGLYQAGQNPRISENVILSKVGVKDRSNLPQAVRKCFMKYDEPQVMQINKISPAIVIDWAACKNDFMDEINDLQAKTDKRFENILSQMQRADGNDDNDKIYKNFTYISGLVNTITSNMVSIVKKACSDHFQIARKAVGVRAAAGNAIGDAKDRVKGMIARESYEMDYEDEDYLEEAFLNKFRKMGVEELENKIEQLKAAVADIEEGNGPKKFLKKAKAELKEAQKALASKNKKEDKAAAKAEKKAAKAEAKAAKKAAKNGGAMPAAESFMLDFDDEIEFEDDEY